MEIVNFQPTAKLAPAPTQGATRQSFRRGVHCLRLNGEIGCDKPISLRAIREALLRAGPFDHLHIQLTSTGGKVAEAKKIYELLRAQPCPVSVEAIEHCQSAGMIILMAGALRFARRSTLLLNHPTYNSRETLPERITAKVLAERAATLAETDAEIADLFALRTGYSADWFSIEGSNEDELSVADALESGLLHEIDGLPCRVDPAWALRVGALPRGVHFPAYLLTQNYVAACHCAASLYGEGTQ